MSNQLIGAEIFAVGTWNGRSFSEADLDGIAAAFDALGLTGRVPLKLGHRGPDARDGDPALGWITKVYRAGDRLLADARDIPTVIYDGIKKGLYKFVSVELLKNVKADTRIIPWVLDAVALLGATQPAVGILKDLQSLTMARGTGLQCDSRVAFARDITPSGGNVAMTDQEIAEMQRKLAEATALNQKQADQLATIEADRNKDKVTAARTAITERFNVAHRHGRIKPAVREQFAFSTRYEADDDAALRIGTDLKQVDAFIDSVAVKPAPKDGTHMTRGGTGGDGEGNADPYAGLTPDEELRKRTFDLCFSRHQDPYDTVHYGRASAEVLRSNADLAERWKFYPDSFAQQQQ
jgi:hypothetical protein